MAWPPPTLPTTRTNTTVMLDTHPAEHNAVNLAVNDIVARIDTNLLRTGAAVLPWAGAVPANRKWMIQTNVFNGITSAGGAITIPFPTPFTGGVTFVYVAAVAVAGYFVMTSRTGVTLSAITVTAFSPGSASALTNTLVDAQMIAIGW